MKTGVKGQICLMAFELSFVPLSSPVPGPMHIGGRTAPPLLLPGQQADFVPWQDLRGLNQPG